MTNCCFFFSWNFCYQFKLVIFQMSLWDSKSSQKYWTLLRIPAVDGLNIFLNLRFTCLFYHFLGTVPGVPTWTDFGLCICHLSVWSNSSILHNSQRDHLPLSVVPVLVLFPHQFAAIVYGAVNYFLSIITGHPAFYQFCFEIISLYDIILFCYK